MRKSIVRLHTEEGAHFAATHMPRSERVPRCRIVNEWRYVPNLDVWGNVKRESDAPSDIQGFVEWISI